MKENRQIKLNNKYSKVAVLISPYQLLFSKFLLLQHTHQSSYAQYISISAPVTDNLSPNQLSFVHLSALLFIKFPIYPSVVC